MTNLGETLHTTAVRIIVGEPEPTLELEHELLRLELRRQTRESVEVDNVW